MLSVWAIVASFLWNDFLYVFFFRSIFREKYSRKVTFGVTIALWVVQVITKIVPIFAVGLEVTMYLSVFMLLILMIHLYGLFAGSVIKRAAALIIATCVQGFMDYLGLNLTSRIVGNYDLYVMDSNFNLVAAFVSTIFITTGMILLTKMWQWLEAADWKTTKREWSCVMLPVSQIFWLWHMIIAYSVNYKSIPAVMLLGAILGLLADLYMLVLFVRLYKKNEAEKQLKELKQQYHLEQVRYEQLKKSQEETAKMRHDFQNYILTLRQME